jgi:hypothetical protein
MFQELIHLLALMLHDLVSDVRCFVICFIKIMIRQTPDLFRFIPGNVSVVGKNRCQYATQMFHFFFRHFVSLLSDMCYLQTTTRHF